MGILVNADDEIIEKSIKYIKNKDFPSLISLISRIKSEAKPDTYNLIEKIFHSINGEIYITVSQLKEFPPEFKDIELDLISWMDKTTDDHNLMIAYRARTEYFSGNYDNCIIFAEKISNISTQDKAWHISTQLAGNSYSFQGRYHKAMKQYEKLVDIQKEERGSTWVGNSMNLAEALLKTGELSSSFNILEDLMLYTNTPYAEQSQVDHHRSNILLIMSGINFHKRGYELAEKLLLKSINLNKKHGFKNHSRIIQLIRIKLIHDNIQGAEQYFQLFEEYENPEIDPRYKLARALILNKKGDFTSKAQAIAILDEVIAETNGNSTRLYAYLEKISIMVDEYTLSQNEDLLLKIIGEIQKVQQISIKGGHINSQLQLAILESKIYVIQKNYEIAISRLHEGINIAKEKDIPNVLDQLEEELADIEQLISQVTSMTLKDSEKDFEYVCDYLSSIKELITEI